MPTGLHRLSLVSVLLAAACLHAHAQQTAPVAPLPAPVAPATKPAQTNSLAPVAAPQVNSVIHRVSGFKMLTLLRRSNARVAPLDDELLMASDMHTSITAGLFLEDGSIVARLPQAEAEVPMFSSYSPSVAPKPPESPPNLFVVERDGQQLTARFIGLDGGTGLSLLSVEGLRAAPPARDAREETLIKGERVRLLSPARAAKTETLTSDQFFLNMSEMSGKLTGISRASTGNVTRLTVQAEKLSPAIVGGIVLNQAGETIGIVESSSAGEAYLIPVAAVRRAVSRIRSRLENKVPQPWLGARGAAVAAVSPEQLVNVGWKRAAAFKLLGQGTGVLLTSVPPQTPAWFANLRAGDVVTRVNAGDVRSAEDFSSLLKAAGSAASVSFTVIAPDSPTPRVVNVKLSESLNPVLEMEAAEERAARLSSTDPLVARGLETLAITPKLAAHLKASGGLLVVFVHPESAAARAGLLAGDVIEAVNGKPLAENNPSLTLSMKATLSVVRNGQKLEVTLLTDDVKQR